MSQSITSITECPPNQTASATPQKNGNSNCLQMVEQLMEGLCCFIIESSEIIKMLTAQLKENTTAPNRDKCMEIVEGLSEGFGDFIPKSSEVLQKLKTAIKGDVVPTKIDTAPPIRSTTDKGVNCCPCVIKQKDLEIEGAKESKSKVNERRKSDLAKRKLLKEKFKNEKIEKLAQIKETMCATQKTLQCIQEQIRQLERLEVDFDTANTTDGQVNPAALYKEIMKPEQVPYIHQNKSCIPPKNPCAAAASTQQQGIKCDFIYQGTIAKPTNKPQAAPQFPPGVPQKVSYLSAMPYSNPRCP